MLFARNPAGGCVYASSTFKLRVQSREPARFYLTDSAGKPWTPDRAIAYDRGDEHHFIMRGGFEIRLPSGTYNLVVERGPQYIPFREVFEAR
jgi:hypothetical protein